MTWRLKNQKFDELLKVSSFAQEEKFECNNKGEKIDEKNQSGRNVSFEGQNKKFKSKNFVSNENWINKAL